MANLFDKYTTSIPATLCGASGMGTTDAITGVGVMSIQMPTGGRYPLEGSIFLSNFALGDQITKVQIRDDGGVIPEPARGAFPLYPVLLNRLDIAASNQGIYFPPGGIFILQNQAPIFLSAGLTLSIEVTKAIPSAVEIFGNMSWLAPN